VRYGFALEIRAPLTSVGEGDGIGTRGSVPKEKLALLSRRAGVSFAWCFWLAREEGGVLRRQSGQQAANKNADAEEEMKTNSRRSKITRSQRKRARGRVWITLLAVGLEVEEVVVVVVLHCPSVLS
jgi:hypothetical protein